MTRDLGRSQINPLLDLFDATAQLYSLRFTCSGCRRQRILAAAAVWWHFRQKGFSPWLRDVPKRFRCRACGRKCPMMDLVHDEPTDHSLPIPPDREWKRETRKRR